MKKKQTGETLFPKWNNNHSSQFVFRDRVVDKNIFLADLGQVWIVESIQNEDYFICKIIEKNEIDEEMFESIKLLEEDLKIEIKANRTFPTIIFLKGYEDDHALAITYKAVEYQKFIQNYITFTRKNNIFKSWSHRAKLELNFKQILGQGGFGKVYLCQRKKNKEYYACKVINKKDLNEQGKANIQREVQFMMKLTHKNIIGYKKGYESEFKCYLVVELCTGGDLKSLLRKKKKISEKKTSGYVKQILEGLQYVHSRGLIHSDIKPANVMFRDNKREVLKLIDFGLSQQCHKFQWLKKVGGTPKYLAPECLKKHFNLKMDLWSVGIMTFEMLYGYVPFAVEKGNYLSPVIKATKEGFISELRPGKGNWFNSDVNISPGATNFIATLLKSNPAKRYVTDEALTDDFILQRHQSVNTDAMNFFGQKSEKAFDKNLFMCLLPCDFGLKYVPEYIKTRIDLMFKLFDLDKSGTIDKKELKQALSDFTDKNGKNVDSERLFHYLKRQKKICRHKEKKATSQDKEDPTLKNEDEISHRILLEAFGFLFMVNSPNRLYDCCRRLDPKKKQIISYEMLEVPISKNRKILDANDVKNLQSIFTKPLTYEEVLDTFFSETCAELSEFDISVDTGSDRHFSDSSENLPVNLFDN